jgi:hypothetical protein
MSPTQSVELPEKLEAILQDVARKAREGDQGPFYLEVCKIIIMVERYLDRSPEKESVEVRQLGEIPL